MSRIIYAKILHVRIRKHDSFAMSVYVVSKIGFNKTKKTTIDYGIITNIRTYCMGLMSLFAKTVLWDKKINIS